MSLSLPIIKYCAEEVDRQRAGPLAVYGMLAAWDFAMRRWEEQEHLLNQPGAGRIFGSLLPALGKLVEPEKNRQGYRRIDVRVGTRHCPEWRKVTFLIDRFLDNLPSMTPEEAYREFEEIHPFVDGNGRVGKILFNWLKRSLHDPVMPPNFFGCSNP